MSYCESGDMGRAIKTAREGSSSSSSNTTGGNSSAASSTSNNAGSSSSNSPQQFGEAAVLRWFVQMCMGVQYLHACQMLHRDLKVCIVYTSNSLYCTLSSAIA
jgi:serine/threonine protein kinase